MDELVLSKELYNNIIDWLSPKYSINTVRQYSKYLLYVFKKYKVLNQETLRLIMKRVKAQNQRAALMAINNYCYDNNIDFHIRIPSIKKQAIKLPQILSPEEINLMIKSAPKPYDLVIRCIFNMGAGLRVSEIIKMSWAHIRWIDWLSNQDNYGVAVIKSGKGSKDRIVNIPKNLMKDLYEYAKETNQLNEYRVPYGGMIFPFGGFERDKKSNRELKKLEITEQWKNDYVRSRYDWFRWNIVRKHCEKALNKKIKIHQLRHSRATYLYEYENVPVEKIQLLLGHSSLNTTMLYTRVNPRSVFEMIKDTKEL